MVPGPERGPREAISMNKMVKGALALAALLGAVTPAIGHGGKKHGGGSDGYAAAYASDCGAPAAPAADTGISYVDQVVTGYRCETRTRTVNQTVSRLVTREVPETYTYTETVPVTVAE